MDALALHSFIANELSRPRHQDPKRLVKYGYKVYAQNDEDGIIAEIFRRIGTEARTFVEFGVERGVQCNTAWLLVQGWTGLWIEASADDCRSIARTHWSWLGDGRLRLLNTVVTAENIDDLIGDGMGGQPCDLLSVDIDYNDYWVWQAIECISPRVVVVEYNAAWPPPVCLTVPYDPSGQWTGNSLFGASLAALAKLGDAKGYHLVGCSLSGVNAFFVRKDLCGDHFLAPGSVIEHYEPPRYFLGVLQPGHPPAIGEVISV